MVRTQNRPISGQIVKIIHDDSNKQIDNLVRKRRDIAHFSTQKTIGCLKLFFSNLMAVNS